MVVRAVAALLANCFFRPSCSVIYCARIWMRRWKHFCMTISRKLRAKQCPKVTSVSSAIIAEICSTLFSRILALRKNFQFFKLNWKNLLMDDLAYQEIAILSNLIAEDKDYSCLRKTCTFYTCQLLFLVWNQPVPLI